MRRGGPPYIGGWSCYFGIIPRFFRAERIVEGVKALLTDALEVVESLAL